MSKRRIILTKNILDEDTLRPFRAFLQRGTLRQIKCLESFINLPTDTKIEEGTLGGFIDEKLFDRLDMDGTWWIGPGVLFLSSNLMAKEEAVPIRDHVFVTGNVTLDNTVLLRDRAIIHGADGHILIKNSAISGDASISEYVTIDSCTITGAATIKGSSHGSQTFLTNCCVRDNAAVFGKCDLTDIVLESDSLVRNSRLSTAYLDPDDKGELILTKNTYIDTCMHCFRSSGTFEVRFREV